MSILFWDGGGVEARLEDPVNTGWPGTKRSPMSVLQDGGLLECDVQVNTGRAM